MDISDSMKQFGLILILLIHRFDLAANKLINYFSEFCDWFIEQNIILTQLRAITMKFIIFTLIY